MELFAPTDGAKPGTAVGAGVGLPCNDAGAMSAASVPFSSATITHHATHSHSNVSMVDGQERDGERDRGAHVEGNAARAAAVTRPPLVASRR